MALTIRLAGNISTVERRFSNNNNGTERLRGLERKTHLVFIFNTYTDKADADQC